MIISVFFFFIVPTAKRNINFYSFLDVLTTVKSKIKTDWFKNSKAVDIRVLQT